MAKPSDLGSDEWGFESLVAHMEDYENCPKCGANLRGAPIPTEHTEQFGGEAFYSRMIGVEVQGVYDGVLYWMCPDCRGTWHRWPRDSRLYRAARARGVE